MANNENLNPAKKGEVRNPKGRPKKLLSAINEQLIAQGYEKVTPSQISDTYSIILGLPEHELKALATDKDAPMLLRIMGNEILNGERGPEIIEMMLSRAHGKPIQTNKNEHSGEIATPTIISVRTEELDDFLQKLKAKEDERT